MTDNRMNAPCETTGRPLAWSRPPVAACAAALWICALGSACGTSTVAVQPDEYSAAGHRSEAARENATADKAQAGFSPGNVLPSPYRDPITNEPDLFYGPAIYNPTDARLDDAEKHRAHARQHQAAAQQLEAFEQMQCKDFPPSSRAACPLLGPALSLEDIPSGVRVTFAPGTRIDAIVAHMRCHLAYARAQGYPGATSCPLYLKGIDVHRLAQTAAVEITSGDQAIARHVQAEARAEVIIRSPPHP